MAKVKKLKKSKLQKQREDQNSRLWRNKADYEWRVYVHKAGKCAICGGIEYLQAHHLIPREVKHFRHDPSNGILLCVRHHKYYYQLSAHKNSLAFAIWLQKNMPEKWQWIVDNINADSVELNYKKACESLKSLNSV